jgi:methyl-accepting chemotaxis protein
MKLKWKITVLILLVLALPVVVIITYSTLNYGDTLKDKAAQIIQVNNEKLADFFSQYISDLKRVGSTIASDPDVSNITNQSNEDTERMYSNLQNYFEQYEEFIAVYVGTKNGDMFMRPVESEKQLPEDFDPRTRPWYKDAVAKPNEVIITDPYIDVVTKDTLVTVSKAVKSSKGEIVGAVGIDLSMAKISEMLKKDLGFKETLFVINNKGIIIFHPDSKRIGLDISNESYFKNLKGQTNVSYVKDGSVFYTCTKLNGIDWTLITEVNVKNLFGEVRSITNVNLFIVIIVAVLAILLGIFFTNRFITKPINQLKTHITEIAKGTTSEKGLTHSYFANPFGAVQRKDKHEKIARKYMEAMMENGVKVGTLRTQLGINGFEEEGPMIAAKTLLNYLKTNNQNNKDFRNEDFLKVSL